MDWISRHWEKVTIVAAIFVCGVVFAEDAKNVRSIPELKAVTDDLVKLHEAEKVRKEERAKAEAAKAEQRKRICAEARSAGVVIPSCR